MVTNNIFPFHNYAFQEGLIHAENVGGDIDKALNTRCIIGAFPWKYEGLESCPCRIVAFYDCGETGGAVVRQADAGDEAEEAGAVTCTPSSRAERARPTNVSTARPASVAHSVAACGTRPWLGSFVYGVPFSARPSRRAAPGRQGQF